MKQDKHTTFTGTRTTFTDVCRWVQTLFALHARIAPRFARPEPRRPRRAPGVLLDLATGPGTPGLSLSHLAYFAW